MKSPEKMAEVRERFSLPEPEAAHECQATQFPDDGSERSTRLSRPAPCYVGQWVLHGPHDYHTTIQRWLGGGEMLTHCPGKTPETVLGK